MRLTVLQENRAAVPGMQTENGLSVFLEKGKVKLLFDMGNVAGHFMDNAQLLGVDLTTVTHVAFSHNHYDHCGGFPRFWDQFHDEWGLDCPVYARPGFFRVKYWDHRADDVTEPTYGPFLELVGPGLSADYLCQAGVRGFRILTDDVFEIGEDVFLIGNLHHDRGFEEISPASVVADCDGIGVHTDDFADEQVCAVRTAKGLIVLTGCAHNGIVHILETVRERLGSEIYAVVGGTHLVAADESRIARTAAWLGQKKIPFVWACHCTGPLGYAALETEVPQYRFVGAGSVLEWPDEDV